LDVITPAEALRIARSSGEPKSGAKIIASAACENGGTDNVTIIVINLKGCSNKFKNKNMKILQVIDELSTGIFS